MAKTGVYKIEIGKKLREGVIKRGWKSMIKWYIWYMNIEVDYERTDKEKEKIVALIMQEIEFPVSANSIQCKLNIMPNIIDWQLDIVRVVKDEKWNIIVYCGDDKDWGSNIYYIWFNYSPKENTVWRFSVPHSYAYFWCESHLSVPDMKQYIHLEINDKRSFNIWTTYGKTTRIRDKSSLHIQPQEAWLVWNQNEENIINLLDYLDTDRAWILRLLEQGEWWITIVSSEWISNWDISWISFTSDVIRRIADYWLNVFYDPYVRGDWLRDE